MRTNLCLFDAEASQFFANDRGDPIYGLNCVFWGQGVVQMRTSFGPVLSAPSPFLFFGGASGGSPGSGGKPGRGRTRYSPFAVRIDPLTGTGPMGIDTSGFKGTSKTAHGGVRNLKEFWKLWSEKYPETLSKANLERLEMKPNARAPIVDEHWIEHFPEHRGYRGQTLTIQHLDQGPIGVPVPKDAHLKGPGPAIWNPPYKPPPGWENWTPP